MFKESGVSDKVSLTADEKPLQNHVEPHAVTDTCLVSGLIKADNTQNAQICSKSAELTPTQYSKIRDCCGKVSRVNAALLR